MINQIQNFQIKMAPQQTENGSITAANNGDKEVWTLNQHLKEVEPEVHIIKD